MTPTILYYDSNNNLLDGPTTQTGTYTAMSIFAGSTDYASAKSDPITFTIN